MCIIYKSTFSSFSAAPPARPEPYSSLLSQPLHCPGPSVTSTAAVCLWPVDHRTNKIYLFFQTTKETAAFLTSSSSSLLSSFLSHIHLWDSGWSTAVYVGVTTASVWCPQRRAAWTPAHSDSDNHSGQVQIDQAFPGWISFLSRRILTDPSSFKYSFAMLITSVPFFFCYAYHFCSFFSLWIH